MITLLVLLFVFMIVFGILGFCLRLTGGVLKLTFKLIFVLPLGILCADCPDRIVAVRKDSPLILGYGEGCSLIASDEATGRAAA